jgi:hypothetical protein
LYPRFLVALVLLAAALRAGALPPDLEERRVVGRIPSEIADSESLGPAPADRPLERIVLVLSPRDPDALARFLDAQQDPSSPAYHRWLTPGEFGERFGPTREQMGALTAWLGEEGLGVESVATGRLAVLVSGRVADVERAFATRIEEVAHRGRLHLSNVVAPSVPARLAKSVAGVLSLHDFARKRPLSHPVSDDAVLKVPLYNTGGSRRLAPADFARIYGTEPLLGAGLDGRGTTIAIVGRTNVSVGDTTYFRQYFGLPAKDPSVVLNGPDPGQLEFVEKLEANLDVQWAGGTAPGADVKLVVTKSTDATDGVDLSALYAIDRNLADVVSVSFGLCENDPDFTPENLAFYANLWAQAAAQGIAVVVASGDSGAAGSDVPTATTGTVLGVNGLSTPPYATCVGGTQFDDGSGSYWSATNDATTRRSANGYIPEVVWNEAFGSLYGTGGGLSRIYARPSWQSVSGLGGGANRAVPDISVNASGHTAYMVVVGHTDASSGFQAVLGTSASAPAFAGLAALLVQKAGGRVGSLNPGLYRLGAAQYAGGAKVFHDVTSGNNSVPGLTGFEAGPGFDLATGLGSPDMAALAIAWPAAVEVDTRELALGAAPAVLSLSPGGTAKTTIALEGGSAAAGTVEATAPQGLSVTFAPGHESAGGAPGYVSSGSPAVATVRATSNAAPGAYTIDLVAHLGTATRRLKLFVAVGNAAPSFGDAVEVQVPVVLDVFGAASSHYTSDLVAVNRSSSDATALLRYVPVPGTSGADGPVIARSVPAGRQLFVPDVIAFLRANGVPLSGDAAQKIGTLYVTFSGVADASRVFAGSRTTTPNLDASVGGSFGTFAAATRSGGASDGEAWVYGLRQDGGARSNLAVVHSPGGASSSGGGADLAIEVQVFDGANGSAAGAPITFTLKPGEFHQINEVLKTARPGLANGYARVRRTSGSDRFIAYGVINDGSSSGNGTSDGSFLVSGGSDGLVPIVLDLPGSPHYRTSLTLTNTSTSATTVTLRYTPSSVFGGGAVAGTGTTTLAPGAQRIEDDAIAFLRGLGLSIPSNGTKQGGTLLVEGAFAQARTYSPNPNTSVGGTYGLSYPAVGASARARSSAVVLGLRQDDTVRSNLAIADARAGDSSTVDYTIEVYDADAGSTSPVQTLTRTLAGGQWTQVDGVLYGGGVRRGWVRVRAGRASDFVVYGVVNDGPAIGSRTSDGSYLPMTVE